MILRVVETERDIKESRGSKKLVEIEIEVKKEMIDVVYLS